MEEFIAAGEPMKLWPRFFFIGFRCGIFSRLLIGTSNNTVHITYKLLNQTRRNVPALPRLPYSTMKFGQNYYKHQVTEWADAYMNCAALKKRLCKESSASTNLQGNRRIQNFSLAYLQDRFAISMILTP